MIGQYLLKKPILGLGILMCVVVLLNAKNRDPWGILSNDRLKPTPCKAVLVRLEKKVPENWRVSCEENDLSVEVVAMTKFPPKKFDKALLYRELANNLFLLANTSTQDILAKIRWVKMTQYQESLDIFAIGSGEHISKLASLNSKKFIMDHLKSTIRIKESLK